MGHGANSAIGSTNSGVFPDIGNRFTRYGEIKSENERDIIANNRDEEEKIAGFARKFQNILQPSHSLEQFRSDTLNDINSGLNLIASGIKVITTILSLFGADTVDRNDNYDEAIGTMMSLGATVLKVGVTKMLETSSPSSSTSGVNKLGVAASTAQLTPEELLQQQQVQAFVSKLTPEQIKLKQQLVQDHVTQQALEQNMNSIQTAQLLAETLQHNGLPQINSPVQNTLAAVVSTVAGGESLVSNMFSSIFGDSTVNKVGVAADSAPDQDHGDSVAGLPKPGTLEHTITLALFKAQQSLNQMMSSKPGASSQPAIDNKLGVAAGEAPGVTFSEVATGVDPTYAALGLLTTGALGTVLYSYVAADSDLASSATALAKGAVDAIKRNDIVQVATNAIASVTGNKFYNQKDPGNVNYNYYDQENAYDNVGYSDYGYGYPPPIYAESDYSSSDPYLEHDQGLYKDYDTHQTRNEPALDQKYPHSIPDNIQFYEPDSKVPEVPYVTYTQEHSPWELINNGQDTEHLYRDFS